MQKQESEYVWHIKLQTCGIGNSSVKGTWNTSYYQASLSSLESQTINLVLRLDIVLINVHFCWSKLLHTL